MISIKGIPIKRGDIVRGLCAEGKKIEGIVVTLHGKLMGVAHQGKLVGDLVCETFEHVEEKLADAGKEVPAADPKNKAGKK